MLDRGKRGYLDKQQWDDIYLALKPEATQGDCDGGCCCCYDVFLCLCARVCCARECGYLLVICPTLARITPVAHFHGLLLSLNSASFLSPFPPPIWPASFAVIDKDHSGTVTCREFFELCDVFLLKVGFGKGGG